jgi:hypothetical protein
MGTQPGKQVKKFDIFHKWQGALKNKVKKITLFCRNNIF